MIGFSSKNETLQERGIRKDHKTFAFLFSDAEKLWMMKGQLELELKKDEEARSTFALAVKKCYNCIPLWYFNISY